MFLFFNLYFLKVLLCEFKKPFYLLAVFESPAFAKLMILKQHKPGGYIKKITFLVFRYFQYGERNHAFSKVSPKIE